MKKIVLLLLCQVMLVHQLHAKSHDLSLPIQLEDQGIFSDLNSKVKYLLPSWLPQKNLTLYQDQNNLIALYYQKYAIAYFEAQDAQLKISDQKLLHAHYPMLDLKIASKIPRKRDHDRDGIADGVDLHLGTMKVLMNQAEYRQGYERIKYPHGDVTRDHGVCTDVIVRAFRNAGWDLQQLLYKDMKKYPKRYGLKKGKKPNRHIDHRRVRRLIRYFKRYYQSLPIEFSKGLKGHQTWLPGDLVFMDTFAVGYPTHVGLVSNRIGEDGEPVIVNNWTEGYSTSEMSLRQAATYTHRFRITLKK